MNGESGGSGRYESGRPPVGGPGTVCGGRCEECQGSSDLAGRRRTKVLRGPLRGLVGMVCRHCVAAREKAPA